MENENAIGGSFDNNELKPRRMLTRKTKRTIFYISMIAFFIAQILLFYVYVNISMFTLAFEEYYEEGGRLMSRFAGLKNFAKAVSILRSPSGVDMLKMSGLMYCFHLAVGTVLALLLSYYIYKKLFLAEFFRVVLFLPSILSAVVMVLLYRYMVTDMYIYVAENWMGKTEVQGLLDNISTRMVMLVVYNLWMGYGLDVLLYTGAMSGINESIVEASELDGCSVLQEFWYVTLPSIFPTLITFIIGGLANFFTNQMHLYTFYGKTAPAQSVGYYLYIKNLGVAGYMPNKNENALTYSELSAFGLLTTLITMPIVLTVRYLLNKFGPRVD